MISHTPTIRPAVAIQPPTRRTGSASWRRMVSLSPAPGSGSARVAQSTVSGSGRTCGRAGGAAGRARTPTEPDDAYATDEPAEPAGVGSGLGVGAGGADGSGADGAGGANGSTVATASRAVPLPSPRSPVARDVSRTTPPGGAPRRTR